jgi:hypothetical protein
MSSPAFVQHSMPLMTSDVISSISDRETAMDAVGMMVGLVYDLVQLRNSDEPLQERALAFS